MTVTARHLSTGAVRAVVTDEAGRFNLPAMPVGPYIVGVTPNRFATVRYEGMVLSVRLRAHRVTVARRHFTPNERSSRPRTIGGANDRPLSAASASGVDPSREAGGWPSTLRIAPTVRQCRWPATLARREPATAAIQVGGRPTTCRSFEVSAPCIKPAPSMGRQGQIV